MIKDDDLHRAALECEEARLRNLPELPCDDAGFSRRFERKMRRLIERTDHPTRYWLLKVAACFLLAILLGSVGMLTFNNEARAAFGVWTRKIFSTFTEYRFVGEETVAPENIVYLPTWIPDGFELFFELYLEEEVQLGYKNDVGQPVFFSYYHNSTGVDLHIRGTNSEIRRVYVGKNPADLYLNRDEGINDDLVWVDNDREALFVISAPCDESTLIKIAESVTSVEMPYLPE